MHEVLVNRLGGLSLPRKSVVRLTDRPDMTLGVYRGRKTTMQQQQQINGSNTFGTMKVRSRMGQCVGQCELISFNHRPGQPVRRHNRDILSIFFNMKACYVFSLESPHRGDSNEYKQYTILNKKKKKITLNYPKSAAMSLFPGNSSTSSKQPG